MISLSLSRFWSRVFVSWSYSFNFIWSGDLLKSENWCSTSTCRVLPKGAAEFYLCFLGLLGSMDLKHLCISGTFSSCRSLSTSAYSLGGSLNCLRLQCMYLPSIVVYCFSQKCSSNSGLISSKVKNLKPFDWSCKTRALNYSNDIFCDLKSMKVYLLHSGNSYSKSHALYYKLGFVDLCLL